jgi:peptide/nickel transport system permease protein
LQLLVILGRRLGQIALTVVLVALLVFGLMQLLPGDPALAMLGDRATDASIARLHHELGLDRSTGVQFWEFLRHAPITLMLTGMAAVLALLIAVPLAFISALRPGSWLDAAIRAIAQLSLSMPVFYIGLVLLIVLAAGLHWFPVGGIGKSFLENIYYLFLPALTLALSLSAVLLRDLRQSLLDALSADYVGFATAKGACRAGSCWGVMCCATPGSPQSLCLG